MTEYKRILVIKLGALGDFIGLTGHYAALRHTYPNAHIALLTMTPFVKLAKASGYFDEVIQDNRSRSPLEWIRITQKVLARGNWDLIIDWQAQSRTRSRYYTLARLGTNQPFCWGTFGKNGQMPIKYTPAKWRFAWGKTELKSIPFTPEKATLSFCKANKEVLAKLPKKYVLLVPGCSPEHPEKRWPAENYRALALRLAVRGIASVVIGTKAEQAEIELICKDNKMAVDLCGQSALLDIPEIAAKALAVVGNDTGPEHMAEMMDRPTITLFPKLTERSAVHRENITNIVAPKIEDISVDEVESKLQFLWQSA